MNQTLLPFMLLFLQGCCCCCGGGSSLPPLPVPSEHQSFVGGWVCDDVTLQIEADGQFTRRTARSPVSEGYFTSYENGIWRDRRGWREFDFHSINGACAQVKFRASLVTCSRLLQTQVPKEWVGEWTDSAGKTVYIRADGQVEVPTTDGTRYGVISVAAAQATLTFCGTIEPISLALVGGQLVWAGTTLGLKNPHYDEARVKIWMERGDEGGGEGPDVPVGEIFDIVF